MKIDRSLFLAVPPWPVVLVTTAFVAEAADSVLVEKPQVQAAFLQDRWHRALIDCSGPGVERNELAVKLRQLLHGARRSHHAWDSLFISVLCCVGRQVSVRCDYGRERAEHEVVIVASLVGHQDSSGTASRRVALVVDL